MHPRNPYKNNPPDFKRLADLYPHFKRLVHMSKTGKAVVNFRNPEVVRSLAVCLFHKDFNLKVELPNDRLSPTLPLRLNYLLWIEDLIGCLSSSSDSFIILDIGCGSSCVYPLLGCCINPKLTFIATEINEKNVSYAKRNVENNQLNNKIDIELVKDDEPFLGNFKFDVCMCNPPFFNTENEVVPAKDRPIPNSSCSGHSNEIVGGDFDYAEKIFQESLRQKAQHLWYTIMLGKKSSFVSMKKLLHHPEVKTAAFTEFCQGRTMRWGAAWSFIQIDTSLIIQPKPTKVKKTKPLSFSAKFASVHEATDAIRTLLKNISVDYEQEAELRFTLKGNICAALPNRKIRRLKQEVMKPSGTKKLKLDDDCVANGFEGYLTISMLESALVRIELISTSSQFHDLLNRFYLYIRNHL